MAPALHTWALPFHPLPTFTVPLGDRQQLWFGGLWLCGVSRPVRVRRPGLKSAL